MAGRVESKRVELALKSAACNTSVARNTFSIQTSIVQGPHDASQLFENIAKQ